MNINKDGLISSQKSNRPLFIMYMARGRALVPAALLSSFSLRDAQKRKMLVYFNRWIGCDCESSMCLTAQKALLILIIKLNM